MGIFCILSDKLAVVRSMHVVEMFRSHQACHVISNYPAWLFWLFVHVYFLIGFGSRLLVMSDRAWAYLTFKRSAQAISDSVDGKLSSQTDRIKTHRKSFTDLLKMACQGQ